MLVLGIETSCDETGVALVADGKRILSNIVSSSSRLHKRFGGVVPEIASRSHMELIGYVLKEALDEGRQKLKDVDLVAVTYGPGLVGALLVGVSFAKALSLALDIPLVGVNHLIAHLYAGLMGKRLRFPFVGLIVSGGHTCLVYAHSIDKYQILGQTKDDAVGEAFDKVAKILALGYPGGPIIEKRSKKGKPNRIRFPRAYLGKDTLNFSFSGLKTAVLYYVRDRQSMESEISDIADIAASFQEAAIEPLCKRALDACLKTKVESLVVGGGVSANLALRERLRREATSKGIKVHFPSPALSLDNAAMVAALGYQLHRKGIVSNSSLSAEPNLTI